ncbi:16S rRNA (cytosine(967)-C(5))-methyltransferase RsmB [Paenibacillus oenotherae]|uniref:16S rRNA (cytosine(967)-C(5))-methyltransferase n=1 Tax=Paenibacillus oenotherae TaxID=1435645 RepID=A0ABS7D3L8_9BACL|nr:16S rRNA (cytosine(967)-C(5))-methyltransferase RsmB [Paenibacillus oenotherae]MBW7474162.1 16S rRNA (cytosine(967)-C(5))-methyltransferase RsmB [Paenibacillus oenotherae]
MSGRERSGGGHASGPKRHHGARNGQGGERKGGGDGKPSPKPSPRQSTAREVALHTLVKVAESRAFSNLQLNRSLQEAGLSRQDAALATELVYGTIQRQRTLDYRLTSLVSKGLDKLAPWVLQLLRMSAYQLLFLDRIPPHAAVNEAVGIAKRRGHAGISGMVNGVLRNMERKLVEMKSGINEKEPVQRIGIQHSYPDWLVERWMETYGEAETEAICASSNAAPHASIRVNRLLASREKALGMLADAGFEASASPLASCGIVVRGGGNLASTDGYNKGLWTLQDESSMLVAEVCAPEPGMAVIDCCAAPGGKTTHLAEIMNDTGRVVANDLHPHKRKLIEDGAERLGLRSVHAATGDAGELAKQHGAESFHLVLLDAPCSGLGVIRRKPEIKWTKTPEDIQEIAKIQKRLLREAAKLVRPEGRLVYSTCTIELDENERQIEAFLKENENFQLDPHWPEEVLAPLRASGIIPAEHFKGAVQLLPQHFGSDGFYIARLKRVK